MYKTQLNFNHVNSYVELIAKVYWTGKIKMDTRQEISKVSPYSPLRYNENKKMI